MLLLCAVFQILAVIYWFITSQFPGIVVDSVTMAIEILCIHNMASRQSLVQYVIVITHFTVITCFNVA